MQKSGTGCPLWVELGFFEIRSSWLELSVRPHCPYLFSVCHNAWQVIDSYVLIKIFNDFYSTKISFEPPNFVTPDQSVGEQTNPSENLASALCQSTLPLSLLHMPRWDYVFSFLNYTQVEVEVEVELCWITPKLSNLFLVGLVHCSNIL